jgi:hypothetical protein
MNEMSHLCKFGVNHSVIIAGLCTKGKSDNINDDMNMVQQLVHFDFAPPWLTHAEEVSSNPILHLKNIHQKFGTSMNWRSRDRLTCQFDTRHRKNIWTVPNDGTLNLSKPIGHSATDDCTNYTGIQEDMRDSSGNWANIDDFKWLRAVQ